MPEARYGVNADSYAYVNREENREHIEHHPRCRISGVCQDLGVIGEEYVQKLDCRVVRVFVLEKGHEKFDDCCFGVCEVVYPPIVA